jgi:hypothetical protein
VTIHVERNFSGLTVKVDGATIVLPYDVREALRAFFRNDEPEKPALTFAALEEEINRAGYDVDHVLLPLADFEKLRADMVDGPRRSLVECLEVRGRNGLVKLIPYNGNTRRFLGMIREVRS